VFAVDEVGESFMPTHLARTATLLLLGLALIADTALAQGRRDRGGEGRQDSGRSAQPRGGGRVEQRGDGQRSARVQTEGRRTERQPPAIQRQPRTDVQPRVEARSRAEGRQRAEIQQRADAQPRFEARQRGDSQQRFENRAQSNDRSGWDGRDDARYRDTGRRAVPRRTPYYQDRDYRDRGRTRVIVPQYRSYGGYRPYARRTYVVPYGYRPYGYRSGWNFNLYFGRPYGSHIYASPGYNYGYYAIDPGFAYGSLRIVDAPRYAQVFVDGYYAGEVDDYDGIFQRLNLEPGPHRIEIVIDESAPPLEFDVHIIPGETVTYHARF
jgi:hypothetical protein